MAGYDSVAATDDLFRIYPDVGVGGYPPEWHSDIKFEVRRLADHRCVRCGHPYVGTQDAKRFGLEPSTSGDGWSPCGPYCVHTETHNAAGESVMRYVLDITPREIERYSDDPLPTHIEARWRVLTVHHLNGVKHDCRWWNLVALCQRCHLQIQGKVRMARVWPWEHTRWFQPYVAGYYAAVYLGENLTRAQTLARLDELLNLERTA